MAVHDLVLKTFVVFDLNPASIVEFAWEVRSLAKASVKIGGNMRDQELISAVSTTLTASIENRDPEDDHLVLATTTLRESGSGEGSDPEDSDANLVPGEVVTPYMSEDRLVAHMMATTMSKASGESESDEEDDDSIAAGAALQGEPGWYPLVYRFGEPGIEIVPMLSYDPVSQTHILSDGRSAADVVREIAQSNR